MVVWALHAPFLPFLVLCVLGVYIISNNGIYGWMEQELVDVDEAKSVSVSW
jgi:hypothetical protein